MPAFEQVRCFGRAALRKAIQLVFDATPGGIDRERDARSYNRLVSIVRNNVNFLANLAALEQWYRSVRHPFFAAGRA